jgi:serine/threonine-protein kinase
MLPASWARATPSAAEKAAAEALFDEGLVLLEKGDVAAGCDKLAGSQELDPAPGTLLRLGDCYDRLGKTASAWASFKQAAAVAKASSQPDREAIAAERALDLEARLSRVKLVVSRINPVDTLQIRLGGVEVPRASWGSPLPVDPGVQRVVVSAPGFESWSTELAVLAGPASYELAIPTLTGSPPAAEPDPTIARTEEADRTYSRAGGTQRAFGYVAGGIGLSALAAGGVLAYVAYDKNTESLDHCLRDEPNACSPEGKTLREDAQKYANLATIGVGAGAGLVVTSLVLLLTAPSSERSTAASHPVAVSAAVTRGSMKLNLNGSF